MKKFLFTLLLICGMSFGVSAQKYGYLDSDFVMQSVPEYSEAKDKLDKLADRWTKEIEERYEIIKKKKEAFNREEVLLPNEEKTKRAEEIKKLEADAMELQKARFGVSGDYFQKRQELIKPIQDKVFDAMQKVASKRNYSFIFDKANQSNLIYADSKFDISEEVIKEMGLKPITKTTGSTK